MSRCDGQLPCVFLLLCTAGSSFSCAARPAQDANSWRDAIEYRLLADARTLESAALDFAGYTPLSAVAFTRLALREDAAAAFHGLLRSEHPAARLYGLKGVWLVDRTAYPAAAAELSSLEVEVHFHSGCVVGTESLKSLITEAPGASWSSSSSPVSLFLAGADWLQAADPGDTDAAGWRATLLNEKSSADSREWAARVLACSLDGPGLEALLRSLPQLDGELRREVWQLLEMLPPWSSGTVSSLAAVLESEDRLVLEGAARAVESLGNQPVMRAECRQLLPRLERILASYAPPPAEAGDEEEDSWPAALLRALNRLGGPAGPVLARAIEHREPAIHDGIEIPWWGLGEWSDGTIAELARRLEHADATVRRRAAALLASGLDAANSPPRLMASVREMLPSIRRAIATLEGEDRTALEELLQELIEPGSPGES